MQEPSDPVALPVPHPRQARNLPIQWLRAIAACAVMLFHASGNAGLYLHDQRFLHLFDGRFGLFGVSLFFAISGYLMAVAITVQKPFLFLSHRAIRIFPLLWMIYVGYYGVGFAMGKHAWPDIRSFLLVPYGQLGGPFGVEWSLTYEFVFYLSLFALALMGLAARLNWIALAWLAVLAISTYGQLDAEAPQILLQHILLHPASVSFAMGLLIPVLLQRKAPPLLLLGAGIIVCVLQTFTTSLDISRWIYGLGATLILAGAIGLSLRPPGNTGAGRIFARAGDYSYALYLCHMPIIWFLMRETHLPFSPAAVWCLAVCASLIAAAILGETELRIYRRLKVAVNAADPLIVKAAMIAFVFVFMTIALIPQFHLPPH